MPYYTLERLPDNCKGHVHGNWRAEQWWAPGSGVVRSVVNRRCLQQKVVSHRESKLCATPFRFIRGVDHSTIWTRKSRSGTMHGGVVIRHAAERSMSVSPLRIATHVQ